MQQVLTSALDTLVSSVRKAFGLASGPKLEVARQMSVPSRVFAALSAGRLSALVVPDGQQIPEGKGLIVTDGRNNQQLVLEAGATHTAQSEAALEPGHVVLTLRRPTVFKGVRLDDPVVSTGEPSRVFHEVTFGRGRGVAFMPATGGIHGQPIMDGDTVAIKTEAGSARQMPVSVMMKGDMPGLKSGTLMLTTPLTRVVVPRSRRALS